LAFFCALSASLAQAQGLQIAVSAPKEVAAGSTVTVDVNLTNVASLGGLLFDVSYDGTSLSLTGVDATGVLASQGLFASNPETFPSTTGKLTFGFLHAQGLSTEGTLVKLTFKVANAPLSPAALDLANTAAVDVALADQAATETDDAVSVLLSAVDLQSGLRMFTLPVQLTEGAPAAVLNVPAAQVKVAAWDPAADNGAGGYVLYDGTNVTFEAGKGYWGKFGAATQLRLTAGRGIDPDQPFTAPVANGWTLLGNPRGTALPWSLTDLTVQQSGLDAGTLAQAQSAGLLADYAWTWDGSQYVLVYDQSVVPEARGAIGAHEAFWLQGSSDNLTLTIPPVTRAAAAARSTGRARQASPDDWDFRLEVSCGSTKDTYNFLGVRPASRSGSSGSGSLQIGSPPPVSPYVDLSFVSPGAPGQRLGVDFRSPLDGRAAWDLLVETDVPNEDVVLQWSDLTRVPNAYRLTLVDKETGERQYMRTTSHYTFRSATQGATRQLAVEVDPSPGAALLLTGLRVTPNRDGSAAITFSSSQPALVTAQLRSANGRVVEVVADGFAANAGVNTVHWSGRTRSGKALARGLFTLQLVARTDEGQASRALTTFSVR